ncbi:MAG: DUF4065 domain-containing protein [Muribaculaceae bacterium]|nr:DUF4065 domain-containing protein [Roseburia sp.]MCM1432025.1 DUF4065 domain-containing protein [Muribaculaceae bacterium]MCM1493722.1 DUF4065 domain-containing protein [Muribaculaceae bacterium]
MEKIVDVAQYIYTEYKRITGEIIDEMKLHKLLYFAQREALAIMNVPLFEEEFEGWKYGPVCKELRGSITVDGILDSSGNISEESKYIVNNVIQQYGSLASWKLSELSHKEISWRNARIGLESEEIGRTKLKLEDIREDAKKIRPYDYIWDMYYDEFEDAEV